jgi:hypothetical protein
VGKKKNDNGGLRGNGGIILNGLSEQASLRRGNLKTDLERL